MHENLLIYLNPSDYAFTTQTGKHFPGSKATKCDLDFAYLKPERTRLQIGEQLISFVAQNAHTA